MEFSTEMEVAPPYKRLTLFKTSAQRVGFFNIGSGRVLDKIPGSGSGSGTRWVLSIFEYVFRHNIRSLNRISCVLISSYLILHKYLRVLN